MPGTDTTSEKDFHKILDNGFVKLVAFMGGDQRAVESARVSFGSVSKGEAADRKLKETTREADRREAALRADLRRGAVRLQDRWACDPSGSAAGGVAGNAGQAGAEERHRSAARIVAAADHDAAVIEWLWSSWQADRKALIAAGYAVEAAP